MKKLVVAWLCACFCPTSQAFAENGLLCSDGERVVFFGDSITCGGGYIGYLQLFTMLRTPGSQTLFMNAGIPGDTAGRAFAALERYLEDRAKHKSAYLAYNRSCVATYKKRFDKREELAAEAERLRAELKAARPAPFTLSVVRE